MRVGVAGIGDAKCGGQINVAVAVNIPNIRAGCALPENRPMPGDVGDVAGFVPVELQGESAGLGAGNGRLEQR